MLVLLRQDSACTLARDRILTFVCHSKESSILGAPTTTPTGLDLVLEVESSDVDFKGQNLPVESLNTRAQECVLNKIDVLGTKQPSGQYPHDLCCT